MSLKLERMMASLEGYIDVVFNKLRQKLDRPFTIAIAGDSLTTEYPVLGDAWPLLLEQMLNKTSSVQFRVVCFTTGGNSTHHVMTRDIYGGSTALERIIEAAPDMVLVAIGQGDHILGQERTVAQTKDDATAMYNEMRSRLPHATICQLLMHLHDRDHVSDPALLKNHHVLPAFWTHPTTGPFAGLRSMENGHLDVSEEQKTLYQGFIDYQNHVRSLSAVDHVIELDLWRVARMGGTGEDGIHVNKLGARLQAAYVFNGLTADVHPVFATLNIKGFAPWEHPDTIFNLLLESVDGHWAVRQEEHPWRAMADHIFTATSTLEMIDVDLWAMGSRMRVNIDRVRLAPTDVATLFFQGGRRGGPVTISINGSGFLPDAIGTLDGKGNMLNTVFPLFGAIQYEIRYKVDDEMFGPVRFEGIP